MNNNPPTRVAVLPSNGANRVFKKYLGWISFVLVLGAVFLYLKFNLPQTDNRAQAQLIISFKDGQSRKFEGAVASDMTILEALYSSSLAGGFNVRYSILKNGAVSLAEIGRAVNIGSKGWHFYLNKKSVKVADINKIKIKKSDLIEVKYE